jgi:hypothetical protein
VRKNDDARDGDAGARDGIEADGKVAQPPDDRGPYGVIYRRLFHRPDFRALSFEAKVVYMYARCCPAGGLVGILPLRPEDVHDDIGMGVRKAERGLRELEAAGFLQRERNWIWIVDSLASTPGIRTSNPKHRTAIHKALAHVPENLAFKCRNLYGLNDPTPIPNAIPNADG